MAPSLPSLPSLPSPVDLDLFYNELELLLGDFISCDVAVALFDVGAVRRQLIAEALTRSVTLDDADITVEVRVWLCVCLRVGVWATRT